MKSTPVASSLLVVGSLTASAGVWAAAAVPVSPDCGGTIQEVVVTATKQKDFIDKVPISIMALTQDQMDREGVRSVDDIARQAPGVEFSRSPYGGGMGSNIAIRGIISEMDASTIGVFLDDVPIQSRVNQENFIGDAVPEVFDLEQVEVLRGPQCMLCGAGAERGAIRFITPAPGLAIYSGYARAEAVGGLS